MRFNQYIPQEFLTSKPLIWDENGKIRADQLPEINSASIGAEPVGTTAKTMLAHCADPAAHPQYNILYRGVQPPSPRLVGHPWEQIDTSGSHILDWFWNGTYWLSKQIFHKESALVGLGNSTTIYYEAPLDLNVFILTFKGNFLLGNTNTTNSYWNFTLQRSGSTSALLASANSSSATSGNWYSFNVNLGIHINTILTGMKAFRIDATRLSVASPINGSLQIAYRLVNII